MRLPKIHSAQDLADLVNELGFLPFFRCGIPGFSVAACTPEERWFSETLDGPWEWKGPVILRGDCAYGKFFSGKAGFISRAWFADFANYRRDGYDFDSRFDEGLAPFPDKQVYDVLAGPGDLLSRELRLACGRPASFEASITRLQMQGYVLVSNFEYSLDKRGRPYGWGVARYATVEKRFGPDYIRAAYRREPADSWARIHDHLRALAPEAEEKALKNLIG